MNLREKIVGESPPAACHRLVWRCRGRDLDCATHPLVMGILNVTPDSFSDGGAFLEPDAALAHARRMAAAGADIIDIGGESTRPGALPVSADEEMARVMPVVNALAKNPPCLLSVDTTKSIVAKAALAAGVHIVNDVSAMADDPEMPAVARHYNAGVILMHRRGMPATMQNNPQYADVVREVSEYLGGRLQAMQSAGLDPLAVALDPGIGFGKTTRHNLQLLANLPVLLAHGRPLVVGLSRKRFLGEITGQSDPQMRDAATLAAVSYIVLSGAHVLRVHDVSAAADAVKVLRALRQEEGSPCRG